jgi:hypothetical protein
MTSGYGMYVATEKALADTQKENRIGGPHSADIQGRGVGGCPYRGMGADLRRVDGPGSRAPARSIVDRQDHKLLPIDQTVIDTQQIPAGAFTKLGLIPQLDAFKNSITDTTSSSFRRTSDPGTDPPVRPGL